MNPEPSPTSTQAQIFPEAGGHVQMESFKTGRVLELTLDDQEFPPTTLTLNPEELRTLGHFLIRQASTLQAGRR